MILTTKEISYLAKAFSSNNILSPFSVVEDQPDGSEYQGLVEKGIIVGNSYNPAALDILEIIAHPERLSKLLLIAGYVKLEKYIYRKGDILVLAGVTGSEVHFSQPDNWDETLYSFSEFFGASRLLNTNLRINLRANELLTLVALIDLYRKSSLAMYIGIDAHPAAFTALEINEEIGSGFKNGLLRLITSNYSLPLPDFANINEVLLALEVKGCLVGNKEEGYVLTEEYALFAKNFRMPYCQIEMGISQADEGGILQSSKQFVVVAGVIDIISIWSDGEDFELETVSGYNLLNTIENYLHCPDLEKALVL